MNNNQQKIHRLKAKLDGVEILQNHRFPGQKYLTNQEFIKILEITYRDAQSIRVLNLIPFQFDGRIIIYRLEDVKDYVSKMYNDKNTPNA